MKKMLQYFLDFTWFLFIMGFFAGLLEALLILTHHAVYFPSITTIESMIDCGQDGILMALLFSLAYLFPAFIYCAVSRWFHVQHYHRLIRNILFGIVSCSALMFYGQTLVPSISESISTPVISLIFLIASCALIWILDYIATNCLTGKSFIGLFPYLFIVSAMLFFATDLGGRSSDPEVHAKRNKNIVLIIVDALRSDRLGCYGYGRPTTTVIDDFARKSVLYENAVVQYPATGPSFGSLFTSKYPRRHGLSGMDPRLWLGGTFNLTLAEILKGNGYTTGAVMTGSLTRSSGLARGFDYLFEEMPRYDTYYVHSYRKTLRSKLTITKQLISLSLWLDPKTIVTKA